MQNNKILKYYVPSEKYHYQLKGDSFTLFSDDMTYFYTSVLDYFCILEKFKMYNEIIKDKTNSDPIYNFLKFMGINKDILINSKDDDLTEEKIIKLIHFDDEIHFSMLEDDSLNSVGVPHKLEISSLCSGIYVETYNGEYLPRYILPYAYERYKDIFGDTDFIYHSFYPYPSATSYQEFSSIILPLKNKGFNELLDIVFNYTYEDISPATKIMLTSLAKAFLYHTLSSKFDGVKNMLSYSYDSLFTSFSCSLIPLLGVRVGKLFDVYCDVINLKKIKDKESPDSFKYVVDEKKTEYYLKEKDKDKIRFLYRKIRSSFSSMPVVPIIFLSLIGLPFCMYKYVKFFDFEKGDENDFISLFSFVDFDFRESNLNIPYTADDGKDILKENGDYHNISKRRSLLSQGVYVSSVDFFKPNFYKTLVFVENDIKNEDMIKFFNKDKEFFYSMLLKYKDEIKNDLYSILHKDFLLDFLDNDYKYEIVSTIYSIDIEQAIEKVYSSIKEGISYDSYHYLFNYVDDFISPYTDIGVIKNKLYALFIIYVVFYRIIDIKRTGLKKTHTNDISLLKKKTSFNLDDVSFVFNALGYYFIDKDNKYHISKTVKNAFINFKKEYTDKKEIIIYISYSNKRYGIKIDPKKDKINIDTLFIDDKCIDDFIEEENETIIDKYLLNTDMNFIDNYYSLYYQLRKYESGIVTLKYYDECLGKSLSDINLSLLEDEKAISVLDMYTEADEHIIFSLSEDEKRSQEKKKDVKISTCFTFLPDDKTDIETYKDKYLYSLLTGKDDFSFFIDSVYDQSTDKKIYIARGRMFNMYSFKGDIHSFCFLFEDKKYIAKSFDLLKKYCPDNIDRKYFLYLLGLPMLAVIKVFDTDVDKLDGKAFAGLFKYYSKSYDSEELTSFSSRIGVRDKDLNSDFYNSGLFQKRCLKNGLLIYSSSSYPFDYFISFNIYFNIFSDDVSSYDNAIKEVLSSYHKKIIAIDVDNKNLKLFFDNQNSHFFISLSNFTILNGNMRYREEIDYFLYKLSKSMNNYFFLKMLEKMNKVDEKYFINKTISLIRETKIDFDDVYKEPSFIFELFIFALYLLRDYIILIRNK